MLRSPLESLGHHRLATAGVVLALAASMWLVAALGATVSQVQQGAGVWWDQFFPVVYLDSGVDEEEVQYLREEIQGLSEVSSVEVESSKAFVERLEEELGSDEVRAMGVEASMMPTALVVHPRIWRPGQAELVARLEAMEIRQSVMEVDAPAPGALSWMERGRAILVGVAAAVVCVLAGSLVGLAGLLRHMQYRYRRENHLLEVFGATPAALRRPTLIRGMALGAAAGVVAGLGFLPWALALEDLATEMIGDGAMPAIISALWSVGIIAVGCILGAAVGWRCSRPRDGKNAGGMDSLLEWEDEQT